MDKSKRGLIVGIPFTALVVALIVYGNLSMSSHEVNFEWEYRPTLYICDDAPEWATPGQPDFEEALGFWGARGWHPGDIQSSSCDTICETSSGVSTACKTSGRTTPASVLGPWARQCSGTPTGRPSSSPARWMSTVPRPSPMSTGTASSALDTTRAPRSAARV